jgi:hypothetical protein
MLSSMRIKVDYDAKVEERKNKLRTATNRL